MTDPLISIISVTYNAAAVIEDTIKSILEQPCKNYEYIVIDGNSKDGTQAVIDKYQQHISYFLSEPDKGIPDALNKGVKAAKGKYLLFILGGDRLLNLPENQLLQADEDVVCFPVLVTGNETAYPEFNGWLKVKNTIPHQGAFFKKTANLVHDTRYKYFCDFALCVQYYKMGLSVKLYQEPIVAFHGLDGATSDKKNFHEVFTIVNENFGSAYKALAFVYWKWDGLLRRIKLR